MSLLSPHESLALLQSGNSEARYERLGVWIAENAPRLLEAAQEPLNMVLGGLGLAALVGSAVSARAAAPSLYHKAVRDLAESEGAITWGYRQGGAFDHFAKLPIPGLWADRAGGVQFVAPTRQGKTQALLPIIIQDLEAGRDVLLIEISGDLGTHAERHARARGVEVMKVDPSDPEALAFNPIYAPSNQKAGQKAAAAMKAVATDHPHYSSMNQNLARFFTILARDHRRSQGRDPNEANLNDVKGFVQNFDHLRRTVGAYEAEDKQTYIDAPWLSADAAEWIEQSYLRWRTDYRETTTSGFVAYLNNLLSAEAARESLCPDPEREVLDLDREVSDGAREPALPGESGRLIVMRFPVETLDGEPAADSAYWALKTAIDTTRARRSEHSTPVSVILDELPTLVGDASHTALKDYQLWITNIGKSNVAVHMAYQGWALLPKILEGTLQSNGRNIFISGGMSGQDARRAQAMLGSELEEEVSEQHELGRSGGRRRNVSVREKPRYSVGEIQKIPRGQWWLLRLHRGQYQDPIVVRVPMAKLSQDDAPAGTPTDRPQTPPDETEAPNGAPPQQGGGRLRQPGGCWDRSRPGSDEGSETASNGEGRKRYSLPGTSNALRPETSAEDREDRQASTAKGGV